MAEYSETVLELIDNALATARMETGIDAPHFDTALIFFNRALQEFASRDNWNWLRQDGTDIITDSGTKKYDLDTDAIQILSAWTVNGGRRIVLEELDEREAKVLYPDDSVTGIPAGYFSGEYTISTSVPPIKNIQIVPTPNSAYTIRVSIKTSIKNYTLTPDITGEVPPIPQYCYDALEKLILKRLISFTKNPKVEIDDAKVEAELAIRLAKTQDAGRNRTPHRIRRNEIQGRYRRMRPSF